MIVAIHIHMNFGLLIDLLVSNVCTMFFLSAQANSSFIWDDRFLFLLPFHAAILEPNFDLSF